MSVPCVSTPGVDDCSAPAVHGAHQSVGLLLGDTPPHLGNACTQLGRCPGSRGELVQLPLKGIPKVFNWVEIGRTSRMRQQVDVILPQERLCSTGGVGSCIVLLVQVLWVTLEIWHDVRHQDLVDVAVGIDPVTTSLAHILKDHRPKTTVDPDGAPNHGAFTSPKVSLCDVAVSKTLTSSPPDTDPTITGINTEPAFITEEHSVPVTLTPVDVLLCPLQAVLAVLGCQDGSLCWSPAVQTCCG